MHSLVLAEIVLRSLRPIELLQGRREVRTDAPGAGHGQDVDKILKLILLHSGLVALVPVERVEGLGAKD